MAIGEKRKKPKKVVWQKHHILYKPELTVMVRRSEHYYITMLQRFKQLSPGAKEAMRYELDKKPEIYYEEKV